MSSTRRLCSLVLAAMAAGCAASGTAVIKQYENVTPTRFEGAVAVVLEDRSTGTVDDRGEGLVTEGFRRIKILDRKALDCGDDSTNCRIERAICYNETWDKVEFIEARAIAPDGQIFPVKKEDIRDITWVDWAIPQQDQRCMVFKLKGASPGAIIEERYRIRSEKFLGVGGLNFQDRDPVLEVSYTIDTPADFAYKWRTDNIEVKPVEERVGNRLRRTWTARDVPPIFIEKGMVAPSDVLAQLRVANEKVSAFGEYPACKAIRSWEDLGTCWHEMIKDKQEITEPVKEVAKAIAEKAKTETEKLRMVWDYMNNNVRYVGLEKGLAGFIPLSAHVVCSKKYGDCKAVAGLITVLCRELGLKADPILIGIRPSLGKLPLDLPGPFHFNHSIARVEADGQVYWMDATYRDLDYKTTPAADQGVHVVVARPGAPFLDFIPVQPAEYNQAEWKVQFRPLDAERVEMDVSLSTTGNTAGNFRSRAQEYPGDRWPKYLQETLREAYSQATLLEQVTTGKDDNNLPFTIQFKARLDKAFQSTGRGISFDVKRPFLSSLSDLLALPKRRYPLDLNSLTMTHIRYEVAVPAGMELAGQPKNFALDDEWVSSERLTQIEGDRVVTEYKMALKQLQIPPEKYPAARESLRMALDASNFVLMFEPAKKKA